MTKNQELREAVFKTGVAGALIGIILGWGALVATGAVIAAIAAASELFEKV